MNYISKALVTTVSLLMISCTGEATQISSNNKLVRIEGSEIKINIGRNFPGSLGVIAPNGGFYVVRDDEINCAGIDILDKVVELNHLNLSGVIWDDGRPRTELIFTEPGEYKIIFAENLETELDGANASIIEVNYMRPNESNATRSAKCNAPEVVK